MEAAPPEAAATTGPGRAAAARRSTAFQAQRARLLGDAAAGPPSTTAGATITGTTAADAAGLQASLARTQALLARELERVAHVAGAIDRDGRLLDRTLGQHRAMEVGKARRALTALEREQQMEHRILLASIAFFWCAVAYVLWGRVLTHVPLFDRALRFLARLLQAPLRKVVEGSVNRFRETEL